MRPRGSQRAAAGLKDFNKGLQEIDADITRASTKGLSQEDRSYADVARSGAGHDKVKLAELDDTITTICDY